MNENSKICSSIEILKKNMKIFFDIYDNFSCIIHELFFMCSCLHVMLICAYACLFVFFSNEFVTLT